MEGHFALLFKICSKMTMDKYVLKLKLSHLQTGSFNGYAFFRLKSLINFQRHLRT